MRWLIQPSSDYSLPVCNAPVCPLQPKRCPPVLGARGGALQATVRRRGGLRLDVLGIALQDGTGEIRYEDRAVVEGQRYGYRSPSSRAAWSATTGRRW